MPDSPHGESLSTLDDRASQQAGSPHQPLLSLVGVHKRFGGVKALRGADALVSTGGVVHALMGENGSGKSTLLGVLSGQTHPDSGSIFVDGIERIFDSPTAALKQGIAMVSQETALALDLSVAENILMGRLPRRRSGSVDWNRTYSMASVHMEQLSITCDPRTIVRTLRPDVRQMVEIARAMSTMPRVLILDEPTSSLTDDEVEHVLDTIKLLKHQDVATILVTHRMREVFAVADEVTVLRDGVTVAAGPCKDFDSKSLVDAMIGPQKELVERPAVTAVAREQGVSALEVDGLEGPGLKRVSFEVFQGEIVGLAGLLGAGRSEVLESIFGTRHVTGGRVRVGEGWFVPASARTAIAHGIGFVPPERKTDGLVLSMSIRENILMAAEAKDWEKGQAADTDLHAIVERLRIKAPSLDAPVGTLSGGNQQKVVLAKWLATKPVVLLLDDPTRGVDVRAKQEIHELLRELANDGLAVVVSCSETSEIFALCDRVLPMFEGRIVTSVPADTLDEKTLAGYCRGTITVKEESE